MDFKRIVGQKKYVDASEDFNLDDKKSVSPRNSSRLIGRESEVNIKGRQSQALSIFSGSGKMGSLPYLSRRGQASNRSALLSNSKLLDQSLISVFSNRSSLMSLDGLTTEFSMNHITPLNSKMQKLAKEDFFAEIDENTSKLMDIPEEIALKESAANYKKGVPVKKVYPNSNITLNCVKGQVQFYAVPYLGYNFPMMVNFNMKVLVKVFVSFVHLRPNYINNDYEFSSLVFKVPKPIEPHEDPKKRYVYICIQPECDFNTMLSVRFESREYKLKSELGLVSPKKEFSINYEEFEAFSDNFKYSMESVKRILRKREDIHIAMNIDLVKDYKLKKDMRLKGLQNLSFQRGSQAKIKSKQILSERVDEIQARKDAREKEIILKRLITERVLEKMAFSTFQRNFIIHKYMFKVLVAIQDRYSKLRKQKQKLKQKLGAAILISSFFCRLLKRKPVENLCVSVSGKKDKVYEINLTDASLTRETLELYSKLNKEPVVQKCKNLAGHFFSGIISEIKIKYQASKLERQVTQAQRSFRYIKAYKEASVNVYSKLFMAIVSEIDLIGEQKGIADFKIAEKLNEELIKEIVAFLFEYYLLYVMKVRFLHSEMPYKEFKTLEKPLKQKGWTIWAEGCLYGKPDILKKYPNCINTERLNAFRKGIPDTEQLGPGSKAKAKEDQIKKLKAVFSKVKNRFRILRFSFDFDDIDIKLFIMQFFYLSTPLSQYNAEELLFGEEYFDQASSPQKLNEPISFQDKRDSVKASENRK